jgi:hypothetical protein
VLGKFAEAPGTKLVRCLHRSDCFSIALLRASPSSAIIEGAILERWGLARQHLRRTHSLLFRDLNREFLFFQVLLWRIIRRASIASLRLSTGSLRTTSGPVRIPEAGPARAQATWPPSKIQPIIGSGNRSRRKRAPSMGSRGFERNAMT